MSGNASAIERPPAPRTAPSGGAGVAGDPADSAVVVYRAGPAQLAPARWHRRRRNQGIVLGFLPPIVLLLAWQLAINREWLDVRLFSSPQLVGKAFWRLLSSGDLHSAALVTTERLLYGYVVGSVLGIVAGLCIGRVMIARAMFMPTIAAVFTVPKLGIYPLLLLIFGLGETPRYLLVGFAAFLVVVLAVVDAASNIDRAHLDVAKVFRASRRRRFFEIILPATLPAILTALRVTIGLSLVMVIATEFVQSREGLGYLIWNSWNLFLPDQMFVGLIATGALGSLLYAVVGLIEKYAVPWARHGSTVGTKL